MSGSNQLYIFAQKTIYAQSYNKQIPKALHNTGAWKFSTENTQCLLPYPAKDPTKSPTTATTAATASRQQYVVR